MFLWDWMRTIFNLFGFKTDAKLLIIGLDNAGKSTLLDLMATGRLVQSDPTFQARSKSLDLGRLRFQAYDLGGHPQIRRVWRDYFLAVDGILFIVDAADSERFEEARVELQHVLKSELEGDVPIAVLFNKTDMEKAVGEQHLIEQLNLQHQVTCKEHRPRGQLDGQRPLETFPTSLKKKTGYGDALRWLAYYID